MKYHEKLQAAYVRNREIMRLRRKGKSFGELAKLYKVSRQRIHQIVARGL